MGLAYGPGRRSAHIVWDWNGTLLHDIHAVIAATNAAFAELGARPSRWSATASCTASRSPSSTSG